MTRFRLSLWCGAAFLYLCLYAPLAAVVIQSFNAAPRPGPWRGFTLEWYSALLQSPDKLAALRNTLWLALASTAVATLLGTLLGYGLSRYTFPGKRLFAWLLYIPMIIPDIVAAVALLVFFAWMRQALGLFDLGLSTMMVAQVTFQIPLVAIVVRARLAGLDPAVEEAARDLGAGSWAAFRHVTLPLMMPGVLAGAALAFTLSLDDFVVSFFTAGPGSTTLPILIYASVKRGLTPEINALATLMLAASVLGTLLVMFFRRKREADRTEGAG